MAKGKRYTAAEKHFMGKAEEFRKVIKKLTLDNISLSQSLRDSRIEISKLESENEQLKEWVERLLKFTEMSKEEVQAVVKGAKAVSTFSQLASAMNFFRGY